LIVLAGDVPPDVVARWSEGRLLPRILLGRGTADAWYTEQKMAADLLALESLGAEVETCIFEGGHEWSPAFLTAASIFLARLVSRETAPPRDDSRRAPVESTSREPR
jgi:predicted esterase